MTVILRSALVFLCFGACTRPVKPANESGNSPGAAEHSDLQTWTGLTPSGYTVRVRPIEAPRVGSNTIHIGVSAGSPPPLSVDIVAPEMPMHGVARHRIESNGGEWSARVDIPMPGNWLLYVNFDAGGDAVEVPLTVVGSGSDLDEAHHHH